MTARRSKSRRGASLFQYVAVREGCKRESSAILAERGYCLRAGFHCAALAHAQLGTKSGTIRFAPSFFSSPTDAAALASYVKKVKNLGKA